MWPASINCKYLVSQSLADLIESWRLVMRQLSKTGQHMGHLIDDEFDLTFYKRSVFPILCQGRFNSTTEGVAIHVAFSSPVPFLRLLRVAMISAGAAFAGLCIWNWSMIGFWALIGGIMAGVIILIGLVFHWVSLMAARRTFERSWINSDV
jgi:hypothetical protein